MLEIGISKVKLQWLQDPSEVNEENLSNVGWEAGDKINELESASKNKNLKDLYRGITEFKKGYELRTNLVKDQNGSWGEWLGVWSGFNWLRTGRLL
jgi:hypothetical protein